MPKAKLEYDLNDLDDRMAHFRAVKSLDMSIVLFEFLYNSRKELRYRLEEKDMSAYDAIDMVFDKFRDLLDENNINVDELIS